jgi:hypothetical protein
MTDFGRVDLRKFVDRGDPQALDFTIGSFAFDATWRDFDLSLIVPAGARWIFLRIAFRSDEANAWVYFGLPDNSYNTGTSRYRTQVANITFDGQIICPCDTNRRIRYITKASNFDVFNLHVIGWFI